MNILITNHHSKENKGDLAILLGLISSLRKENKDIKFNIIGRYIEERVWWEKQGISFFVPILSVPKNGRWKAIKFVLRYHLSLYLLNWPRGASFFYSSEKMKTLKVYEEADIVISKGGSFFREPEYKINFFPIGIMGHLHQLILAQKFKKPVILSAQSFGPINNPYSRYITSSVFKKCSLITTRDTESETFLRRRLNVSKNVFSTGDSAFLVEEREESANLDTINKSIRENKQKGYKCVGLTVRSWSNEAQFESYLKSLTFLIETYVKEGFYFYLMPQVVGPYKEDDRRVSNKIRDTFTDSVKDKVMVIEDELEVGELINLYGQMDYFVATRLHSAIFSILSGTPVMVIGYEPKSQSIFTDLNLAEYVLDIRTISPDKIKKLFGVLLDTPKELFNRAKEKAVSSARENIELISNAISKIEHSQARRFLETTRGYSHSYERNRRIEDWASKERVAGKIVKDFEKRVGGLKDKNLLDAGFGNGAFSIAFGRAGADVSGIELNPALIDIARENINEAGIKADLRLYDGSIFPFDDNTFDYVYSTSVLEHVSDPKLFLKEIDRVLKPDGLVYLSFPNRLAPVETHTGVWFLSYLPRRVAERYLKTIKKRNTIEELNLHFLSYPTLRKYLADTGLSIRFETESSNVVKALLKKGLALLKVHHSAILKTVMVILEKKEIKNSCIICGHTFFSHYYYNKKNNAEYKKCRSCGTIVLEQKYWPKDIRTHYNEYYDDSFTGRFSELDHFKRRADFLVSHLKSNSKIFEIGAASGESLYAWALKGFQVGGSELSLRAVEAAKKNYDIPLINGTLFDAHLADASQDAVVMHHVLEHIEDPRALLREVYRILKSSGMIIVEVPNPRSLDALISRSFLESILDFPHHLFAFPPKALIKLLKQVGFETFKFDTPPSYWLISRIRSFFQHKQSPSSIKGEKQIISEVRNVHYQYLRRILGWFVPGMVYTVLAKKK